LGNEASWRDNAGDIHPPVWDIGFLFTKSKFKCKRVQFEPFKPFEIQNFGYFYQILDSWG